MLFWKGVLSSRERFKMNQTVEALAHDCGYPDIPSFLDGECADAVIWGICSSCNATIECAEPDLENGFCPECECPTFSSVLVLLNLI